MPDRRTHRGPNPEDVRDFAPEQLPRLREAHADFSWLLNRGYARGAGIKLVGDRHALTARQRTAVARCACSDQQRLARQSREVPLPEIAGHPLWIDGFNLLTTVEAAMSGGVVLVGRDGCVRDMASMNGHYKHVKETGPALRLIAETLKRYGSDETRWLLDRAVSNSGRLGSLIQEIGKEEGWKVELVQNPDPLLAKSGEIVATADSAVLDVGVRWVNLSHELVLNQIGSAWLIRLEK